MSFSKLVVGGLVAVGVLGVVASGYDAPGSRSPIRPTGAVSAVVQVVREDVPLSDAALAAARAATVELTSVVDGELGVAGSGAVVDAERGIVVTNAHVAYGADEVWVRASGAEPVKGTILGAAPCDDLTVVQMSQVPSGLGELSSGADPAVGDAVVALGYPVAQDGSRAETATVSWGQVIEPYADLTGDEAVEATTTGPVLSTLVAHTAPIDPGNSGGPLLDADGRLVGLSTLESLGDDGTGFSVPVTRIEEMLPDLVAGRSELEVGWGLVSPAEPLFEVFSGEDADRYRSYALEVPGVWVSVVTEDTPAEKTMVAGDYIVAVAGEPVAAASQVCRVLEDHRGETVRVDGRYLGSAAAFDTDEGDRFYVNVRVPE